MERTALQNILAKPHSERQCLTQYCIQIVTWKPRRSEEAVRLIDVREKLLCTPNDTKLPKED